MRTRRILATVVLGSVLALAAGCGGDDEASAEGWADDVCGSVGDWRAEIESIVQGLVSADTSVDDVQSGVEAGVEATQELRDELADLDAPETESGEEAKQAIDSFADDVAAAADDVRAQVEALPEGQSPTELLSSLAAIAESLESLRTDAEQTLDEIRDIDPGSELEQGVDSAESCDELRGNGG
jgi:hypothetical protein